MPTPTLVVTWSFLIPTLLFCSTCELQSQTPWNQVGPTGDLIYNIVQTSDSSLIAEGEGHVYRLPKGATSWELVKQLDLVKRTIDNRLLIVALKHVTIALSECCNSILSFDNGKTWKSGE